MLNFFLESFSLMVFSMVHFFFTAIEYRFHFFNSSRHAHILVQYLKTFHQSKLSIFKFLKSNRVRNVSQFFSLALKIFHLFVFVKDGMIVIHFYWCCCSLMLFRRVIRILYFHEVK